MMGVIRRQGGTRQDVGGRSARARRPGPQRRQPSRSGRAGGHGVAPGDQMTGIDQSAVGRMWSSADLFASDGRRGRACPGRAQPDFDSGALFARGTCFSVQPRISENFSRISWRISSHITIVAIAGRIARICEAAPLCVGDIASLRKTLVSMTTIGRGFVTTHFAVARRGRAKIASLSSGVKSRIDGRGRLSAAAEARTERGMRRGPRPKRRSAGNQPRSTQLRMVWSVTENARATSPTDAHGRTAGSSITAAARSSREMIVAASGEVRRTAGNTAWTAFLSCSVKARLIVIGLLPCVG